MRRSLRLSVVALLVNGALVVVPAAPASASPTVPGVPMGVAVTPAVAGVVVRWAPPASDGGSPLTGYVVTPSVGSPVPVDVSLTDLVVDADPGAHVSATVKAVNAIGESAESASAGPATATAPGGLVRIPVASRLVDTRTGTGLAKAKLGAGTERVVQVSGKAGVPASGVAAVFVNLTAVDETANTSLTVFTDGTTAPATASMVARKAERVTHSVEVRLSAAGRIRVKNSAGAVNVVIDMAGYVLTPAASGASTNGLVTTTTPTAVVDTRSGLGAPRAKVGAAKQIDVVVAGKGGVPNSGVAGVFVNLTTFGATVATTLTAFPIGTRPGTWNLSAQPGTTRSNRVLVRLGTGGKIRVYNATGAVDVKIDVTAWVASGADASLTADSLNPQSPRRLADTSAGTGTTKAQIAKGADRTITAAGNAGVPKMTATTPPTAVLAFVRVTTTTSNVSVSLRAAGTAPPATTDVAARAGQRMGNVVLVQLSADGKLTVRNSTASTGAVDVSIDIVGWIGGSVLTDPHLKVLDAATNAAVTSVTPSAVAFSTSGGTASTFAVGDIIAAGITAQTPEGILRRVTAVHSGAGAVTFDTQGAGLADVIRRGRMSTGTVPTAPAAPSAGAGSGAASPHIGGGVSMELSYDMPIDETLAESGGATVALTGLFHAAASAAINVDVGFTGYKVDLDVGVEQSFDATLDVAYAAQWSKSLQLGPDVTFGTYEFPILGVPVVVTPLVRFEAETSGSAEGQASGSIHEGFGASAGVTISNTGVTPRHSLNFAPPTFSGPTATAKVDAKVSAVPTVALRFYGAAEAGIQLRPYIALSTDVCTLSLSAGIDLGFKVDFDIADHEFGEYSPDPINLTDDNLATIDLPTCEHWTGQIYWRASGDYQNFTSSPQPRDFITENGFITMNNRNSFATYSMDGTVQYTCDNGANWNTGTNSRHAVNAPGTLDLEIKFYEGQWAVRSGIAEGFDADGSTVGCPGFTYTTNGLPADAPMCSFKDFMERAIPSDTHAEGSIELAGVYGEATPTNAPPCSNGYGDFQGGIVYAWQLTRAPDSDVDGLADVSDPHPDSFDSMPIP